MIDYGILTVKYTLLIERKYGVEYKYYIILQVLNLV